MEKNISEREISLWDMFWAICQKWRIICLTALLVAVLAGAVSYIRSSKTARIQKQPQQAMELEELGEEDQTNAGLYLDYFESYQNQLLYNHESPLMQLDANGFYVSTLDYFVDNHFEVEYPTIVKNNNVGAVIQAYKASLGDREFGEKLQNELKIENEKLASYVMEQVDCDNTYGVKTEMANVSNLMRVSIYAGDEETCGNLAEAVKAALEQKKAEVTAQFGAHDLILLNESCSFAVNNELLTYQKNNIDKLYAQSKSLTEIGKLLSDDAQNYVDQFTAEQSAEDAFENTSEEEVQHGKAKVSKKYVLAGFVAGAVLAFLLYVLLYLVSNRLMYEDDFEELYGVKLFGRIEKERRKKLFGFVDAWFLRLRRMNQHHFEQDEVAGMIYTGIKLAAQKRNVKSIYVTGSGFTGNQVPFMEQIAAKLKKDGIDLEMGKSALYYAEALERLAEVGNVVLLEKVGESIYQEIQQEIEICQQQDADLLGAVVVE